jgi:hypothetical protein
MAVLLSMGALSFVSRNVLVSVTFSKKAPGGMVPPGRASF